MDKFFGSLFGLVILILALRWLAPSVYAWMVAFFHLILGVIRQ